MQKITLMRGIPASGKSSMARQIAKDDGNTARVNMDDIRAMHGLDYSKATEKLALKLQDAAILGALDAGMNVIVDNCHIHEAWPRRIATMVWEHNYDVEWNICDVSTSAATATERNTKRRESPTEDDSKAVPDHVIIKMANDYANQHRKGLWTIESIHRGLPEIVPVKPNARLRQALIVDIDGTLAAAVGRSPYEHERCDEDALRHEVAEVVWAMHATGLGHKIILCSGRDSKYRLLTENWLAEHSIPYDQLFMRAEGDQRRDSVVKLELFNQNIRGVYDVTAAIDDRQRVCLIWHALGIPVMRVGHPTSDF